MARLGGLLYRFRCVDNKNPDSSPASVIWERNYRDCTLQQRYTFCFNSLILYRDPVRGTNCTPHQFSIDQVHKHSETALDPQKKEGAESSFPVKMHLIIQRKAWPSVKSYGFTDEVVKMNRPIRKVAGFYG